MIPDSDFDKKLLAEIKDKKITPKPRWRFLLKNYTVWAAGVILLIIGSTAVAVIIYLLRYGDWNIYQEIHQNPAGFMLLSLPYFWFIFTALFVFVACYNIKHTKKGYRYSLPMMTAAIVLANLALGAVFFHAGFGQAIDDILGQRAPFYDRIFNRRIHFWSQPGEGRLAGIIIRQSDTDKFILLDRLDKEWNLSINSEKTPIAEELKIGRPVRLLGRQLSDNEFAPSKILPIRPGRSFFFRLRQRHSPPPRMFRRPSIDINSAE